ncbi:MAG: ATP-grasp domain-containing protein [Candidatus Sericytochromatia bacterium]
MQLGFLTAPHLAELTADDRLVLPYLHSHGIDVVPVIWSDPASLNQPLDALVMRSCWGYYSEAERFRQWLQSLTATGLPVHNPVAVMLKNLDKRYLLELQAAGWPIVPTRALWPVQDPQLEHSLTELRAETGWDSLIVKPMISASGHATHRLGRQDSPPPELVAQLQQGVGLLVQPFVDEIHHAGEWSLIFFNGRFSHAVNKRPHPDHHLVQEEYGGLTAAAPPPPDFLDLATELVGQHCGDSLYARVDGLRVGDHYAIMELELLEPSLYLAHEPGAAARWARALCERLA